MPESMNSDIHKIYFPGLNGLRFLAAFIVILHHIEFVKNREGLPSMMNIVFFQQGHLGVILFFVLSGFLITYLLLVEQKKQDDISLKRFYYKRVLRIWPLYYLMVFLVFFLSMLVSEIGLGEVSWQKFLLYLFILPNLVNAIYTMVEGIYHFWTIGVEEQFYLLWPLQIKFVKVHLLKLLIFIMMFFPVSRLLLLYFYKHFQPESFYVKFCHFFLSLQVECMAVGGIGAYILFYKKERILKIIYSKTIQVLAILIIIYSLFYKIPSLYFNSIFLSILFIILILNVSTNSNSLVKLENKIFNYLGKISYGLYVYHLIIIFITLKWILRYTPTSSMIDNILLYVISISMTIAISSLSFHYFEKRFLALKEKLG